MEQENSGIHSAFFEGSLLMSNPESRQILPVEAVSMEKIIPASVSNQDQKSKQSIHKSLQLQRNSDKESYGFSDDSTAINFTRSFPQNKLLDYVPPDECPRDVCGNEKSREVSETKCLSGDSLPNDVRSVDRPLSVFHVHTEMEDFIRHQSAPERSERKIKENTKFHTRSNSNQRNYSTDVAETNSDGDVKLNRTKHNRTGPRNVSVKFEIDISRNENVRTTEVNSFKLKKFCVEEDACKIRLREDSVFTGNENRNISNLDTSNKSQPEVKHFGRPLTVPNYNDVSYRSEDNFCRNSPKRIYEDRMRKDHTDSCPACKRQMSRDRLISTEKRNKSQTFKPEGPDSFTEERNRPRSYSFLRILSKINIWNVKSEDNEPVAKPSISLLNYDNDSRNCSKTSCPTDLNPICNSKNGRNGEIYSSPEYVKRESNGRPSSTEKRNKPMTLNIRSSDSSVKEGIISRSRVLEWSEEEDFMDLNIKSTSNEAVDRPPTPLPFNCSYDSPNSSGHSCPAGLSQVCSGEDNRNEQAYSCPEYMKRLSHERLSSAVKISKSQVFRIERLDSTAEERNIPSSGIIFGRPIFALISAIVNAARNIQKALMSRRKSILNTRSIFLKQCHNFPSSFPYCTSSTMTSLVMEDSPTENAFCTESPQNRENSFSSNITSECFFEFSK